MALDNREKFVHLATKRVNNALKNIGLIGNLSNRNNYKYTEEDTRQIFKVLRKEIDEAERRFRESGGGGRVEWNLKEETTPAWELMTDGQASASPYPVSSRSSSYFGIRAPWIVFGSFTWLQTRSIKTIICYSRL